MKYIYFTVFKAKASEMDWILKRQKTNEDNDGDNSGGYHVVKLRGLPFECCKDDIRKFFEGTLTFDSF